MSEDDDRIQEMVEAQHEDPDSDESEFGFEMQIVVPNLEDDAPPLTDEQIKFGLANHAMCMQQLIQVANLQEGSITTLLYIMAAYMKQYPLDASLLAVVEEPKVEAPAPTGQYL